MFRNLLLYSLLGLLIFSCKEEDSNGIEDPIDTDERHVLVLNEGNFRSANASISVYLPNKKSVHHDVYSNANQDVPLGDVVQSANKINGNLWLVVNNSNRIEILEPRTYKWIGRVSALNSPRYCIPGPNGKVYVSDLYEGMVYVVDVNSYTVTDRISTNGWTEEMLLIGDSLFVCQVDSSQLLVINTMSDSIVDRIPTAKSPLSLVLDINGKIWIGCSGGFNDQDPALMKIDPKSLIVEMTLSVPDVSKSIGDLAMSPSKDELYFLMDDLYKMDINATALPANAWVTKASANFYAMDVDPFNGDVYLSDAIDYQQDGVIYRYDSNGQMIHQFKTGLIPGFFYFDDSDD
ncbi:MAG: hypothetical protein CMP59_04975 [Flavobacteriales bacterium]|nr:hypothetical protein [Flavobacteriales bacterium]